MARHIAPPFLLASAIEHVVDLGLVVTGGCAMCGFEAPNEELAAALEFLVERQQQLQLRGLCLLLEGRLVAHCRPASLGPLPLPCHGPV